jgi:cytoskeletal protein CcmA (bactofilin family)
MKEATMGWGDKKQSSSRQAAEEIANLLEASTLVRGDLKSDRGFRVDGRIEGSVESAAAIVIGERGHVTGDVRGSDVIVVGRVDGNIRANGHLDIRASGVVIGDVTATSFRIETGGVFRGTSRMGQSTEEEDDHSMEAAHSLA